MGLLTGLFRTMRKRLSLTTDTDMGAFRDKIKLLVEQKDSLDDGAVAEKVTELMSMTDDLPDGEDKEKLKRYLEDFKSIKSQDGQVAEEAAKAVADLFEKLDKEAMEGDLGVEPPAEPPAEEEVETEEEETVETGDGKEEVKEEVEEKAEEEEKTEDADPDPEYTLEEIYQFVKKRMAEDAAPGEEEEEVETEEEEKVEDACGVKDHGMPGITLKGSSGETPARGGLKELYKTMKGE